jgi:hypothetical protein
MRAKFINRFQHCGFIINIIDKYFNNAVDIITGLNPSEATDCKNAIAFIKDTINTFDAKDDELSQLEYLFNVYNTFSKFNDALETLFKMFDNEFYMKMVLYNMSATYSINVRNDRQYAHNAYEKYQLTAITDDIEIFSTFETMDVDTVFFFIIKNENVINKFTISLINTTIQRLDNARSDRLKNILEKQKDLILGSTRIISSDVGIQGQLIRYNLFPITKSQSLESIFNIIDQPYNTEKSADDNFASIDAIVIQKASKSPIEFDIRGLIDLEYITENNFKISPVSGLNKKVIEKYDTAKNIGVVANAAPQIMKIYTTATSYYIFETINGSLYRLLSTTASNYKVPADKIIGLIKGILTRPTQYNKLHEDKIISRCFDSKYNLIMDSYISNKKIIESSSVIKDNIIVKMKEHFEKNVDKITSVKELKEINVDDIKKIISRILTYRVPLGKGAAEYSITHVVKLELIMNTFIRELERRWASEKINDNIFTSIEKKDLMELLIKTFTSVVKSATDFLDRDNSWTEYDKSIKEYFLDKRQGII